MDQAKLKERIAANRDAIKKLIFGEDTPPATDSEPKKVEAAKVTLVDGTEVSVTPALEVGATATVLGSDGAEIAAPDGSHELQDGTVVTIAGGVIIEIKPIEEPKTDEAITAVIAELATVKTELAAMKVAFAAQTAAANKQADISKQMFEVVNLLAGEPAGTPAEPKKSAFEKQGSRLEQVLSAMNHNQAKK